MCPHDEEPTGRTANDGRTPSHNFRVPDELWSPFIDNVEARGDKSPSWVLRQAIIRYNRETDRRRSRGELPGFVDDI